MADKKDQKEKTANESIKLHAVIYTDGGCKPSRGFGGWGAHGYVYDEKKPTQGSGCKGGQPTAKGYVSDKKVDFVNTVEYIDGWGSFSEECTNNVAEITALLRSLEFIATYPHSISTVLFLIDSQYVINGASKWITKWSKHNWIKPDGEEVANASIWKEVERALATLTELNVDVKYKWVKGHSGNIGNEIADRYAGWGIVKSKQYEAMTKFRSTPAKGYWSPKNDINRMFCYNHWYFNTHTDGAPKSFDGRFVYHQGNQGKEDDLGYSASTAVYSVIMTKEVEPVLEKFREQHDAMDKAKLGKVVVGRLDNIFKPGVYQQLKRDHALYTYSPKRSKNIHAITGEPLTQIQEPARLAFRAVESLCFLEDLLERYLKKETEGFVLTDITEEFYYHDEKDKKKPWKIRKDVDSKLINKKIPVNYDTGKHKGSMDVILTLGSDIARRNTLAALAERNPRVYVIAWRESDTAFRFGTIIEANDDVGIWTSVYSNLKLLNH